MWKRFCTWLADKMMSEGFEDEVVNRAVKHNNRFWD